MRTSIAIAALLLPLLIVACSGSSSTLIDPGLTGPGIDQDAATYVTVDGGTAVIPAAPDASTPVKDAGDTPTDAGGDAAPEPSDAGNDAAPASDAGGDAGPGPVDAGTDANGGPTAILTESFAGLTGGSTSTQCQTGNTFLQGGNLAGWTKSGTGAVHAVQLAPGDYATAFFNDSSIVLTTGVAANTAGTTYTVSFRGGPSAATACGQATKAGDGLVISVLRGDDSVLESFTFLPGAWTGAQTLGNVSFPYQGDGTGNVRLRVTTNIPGVNRFGGAIDDLSITAP